MILGQVHSQLKNLDDIHDKPDHMNTGTNCWNNHKKTLELIYFGPTTKQLLGNFEPWKS